MKTLPKTTGKWMPILRGKGTPDEKVVGWLEVWFAPGNSNCPNGAWVSVPDVSRWVEAKGE